MCVLWACGGTTNGVFGQIFFFNSPFSVLTFQILKEYFDRCGKEVTGTLPKQWKCHRNAWGEDAEGDL